MQNGDFFAPGGFARFDFGGAGFFGDRFFFGAGDGFEGFLGGLGFFARGLLGCGEVFSQSGERFRAAFLRRRGDFAAREKPADSPDDDGGNRPQNPDQIFHSSILRKIAKDGIGNSVIN